MIINNLKKTWNIINDMRNKNKCKSSFPAAFTCNDTEISDPMVIANKFNDFFVNIGPTLANNINITTKSADSYLQGSLPQTIFLNQTSEDEINHIIKRLKLASTGWDDIDTRVLKFISSDIAPLLCHIVNSSLSTGIIPNELKIAKVVPIFKADYNKSFSYYRPISVLPVI